MSLRRGHADVGDGTVTDGETSTQEALFEADALAEPMEPGALRSLLDDRRYLVLGGILVLLAITFTLKWRWGSGLDIWEHAAAARELGEHPFDPDHPLFALDRPHQFFSPYHLIVGLVSRITGLSIVTVLSWAAIPNLVLLLVALWLFVSRYLRRREPAFYAVLFILLLWGASAPFFSGFLHFKVLPLVLSYPSTFAKALALFSLWLYVRFLDSGEVKLLAPIVVMAAVALLAHPVDALFLYVGIVALTLGGPRDGLERNLLMGGGAIVVSFVLALFWPYFSLYELLFGPENEAYRLAIAGADRDMYHDVLGRIWPMLIVVPFVMRRLWLKWNDALSLFLVGLLLGYWYGWLTDEWSYGRLIAVAMLVGAVILADERIRSGDSALAGGEAGRPALRWIQITTVGLLLVGAFNVRGGFIMLPDAVIEDAPYSWVHADVDLAKLSQYSFLSRFVDDDVVLSDEYTSLEVPTYGGKAVAIARAEAFVDTTQRGTDLIKFFTSGTTEAERKAIIDRYGVRWLLLRNERIAMKPDVHQPLFEFGNVVFRNERFTLIDLGPRPVPEGRQ